ncbi:UNVERIFIED_CONTAM: GGDEF domain-containing protein, partial [Bacteroidetes bacterium 56_B9]
MKRVAETDPLTGVLNRSAFLDQLEPEHRRVGGWILVLDVDHFKSINDRFGHEVGDRALRKVAGVLRRSARTGDLIGRLGGE